MPKPNSFQLKRKATILNWPANAWNKLTQQHKFEVWKVVYGKEMPAKTENKNEGKYEVKVMPMIEVNGKPLKFNV